MCGEFEGTRWGAVWWGGKLFAVGFDDDFDAAIGLLASDFEFESFRGAEIIRLGLDDHFGVAVADGFEAVGSDIELSDEPILDRVRAIFAEDLVGLWFAGGVGVAFDNESGIGVALDEFAEFLELGDGGVSEFGASVLINGSAWDARASACWK